MKLVIIEDEQQIASLYKSRMEREGFDVQLFHSPEVFIKNINHYFANVYLIDQSLGSDSYSGIDLIPMIKSIYPDSKIIILSNYSSFQLKDKAMKAGSDDYLVKIDYSPKKLITYLNNLK